jgi:membrane bound regulatory protein
MRHAYGLKHYLCAQHSNCIEEMMQKKTFAKGLFTACTTLAMVAVMMSAMPAEEVMSRENGVTIVNTTSLSQAVKGFKGATPVKIYIEKNKILKIETLPNQETPKYFNKAKTLLEKFAGMRVAKAAKADVDGVTGATFSSKALKKNVQLGLEYYQKHK